MRPGVLLLVSASLLFVAAPPPAYAGQPAAPPAAGTHPGPEAYLGRTVSVPASPTTPARTFRVEAHLGSGYWSHTYQGVDTANPKERVAIKLIKPEHEGRSDSFDKETGILTRAVDPRLPKVYGVGVTHDGRRAMVMELLSGKQIGTPFTQWTPRPAGFSVATGMQVLRGVRALENAGLRHNDVHPGNVVVKEGDPSTVKLIDVGNAGPASAGSKGKNGFYTAPTHGEANDDVYSAGALVLQMMTGAPSRDGLVRIGDPGLRAVLKQMTHPDPARRFPTAQAGIDALRPYAASTSTLRTPAERRAALSTFYGEESVGLAEFGGFRGGADGRAVEGHAGWAHTQSPEALRVELTRKLDEQMKPGRALSESKLLARHYANVAIRTDATGAVLGGPDTESPDWNAHYAWARSAPRNLVRDEIVRRTSLVVTALGARER